MLHERQDVFTALELNHGQNAITTAPAVIRNRRMRAQCSERPATRNQVAKS